MEPEQTPTPPETDKKKDNVPETEVLPFVLTFPENGNHLIEEGLHHQEWGRVIELSTALIDFSWLENDLTNLRRGYRWRGMAKMVTGNWWGLLTDARRIQTLCQNNPDTEAVGDDLWGHLHESRAFLSLGLWEQALEKSRETIRRWPNSDLAFAILAEALEAGKQTNQAIDAAKQALNLLPAFPGHALNLGILQLKNGNLPEATRLLDLALEKAPSLLPALVWRAVCAFFLQDPQTGLRFLGKAQALNSQNPETLLAQSLYLLSRNMQTKALETLGAPELEVLEGIFYLRADLSRVLGLHQVADAWETRAANRHERPLFRPFLKIQTN
jgi:tetratricopeptide (TPR) repeat protein